MYILYTYISMYIFHIFKIYIFGICFAYIKYIFLYLCILCIYFIHKIYISENTYKIHLAILAVYLTTMHILYFLWQVWPPFRRPKWQARFCRVRCVKCLLMCSCAARHCDTETWIQPMVLWSIPVTHRRLKSYQSPILILLKGTQIIISR